MSWANLVLREKGRTMVAKSGWQSAAWQSAGWQSAAWQSAAWQSAAWQSAPDSAQKEEK